VALARLLLLDGLVDLMVGVRFAACLACMLVGCGIADETEVVETEAPVACVAGELPMPEGGCKAAGLPKDMRCAPGEVETDDGGCRPPGPSSCAPGFVPHEDGCTPVLPESPCAPGSMAIVGETRCREVAPCAPGTWGDIVVNSLTEFVDGSYVGGQSDGSAMHPWTTVQEAVNAAAPGATVAIAAGTYTENVVVDEVMRLWGRCPSLVSIVGADPMAATIELRAAESGIHDLAVSGPSIGVLAAAPDVHIERAWIHDTGWFGVIVQERASSLLVRDSLLEAATKVGAYAFGARLELQSTVVRDTAVGMGGFGRGVNAEWTPSEGRATLQVRTSLVERSLELGIFAGGADALVEASVVRDTRASAEGYGAGVLCRDFGGERGSLEVDASVISGSIGAGVFTTGSDTRIVESVVRDTQPEILGQADGSGVFVLQNPETAEPASLELSSSTVLRHHDTGVAAVSAAILVHASNVRDILPRASDGQAGVGILVTNERMLPDPPPLTLSESRIEDNHLAGLLVLDAPAHVDKSAICRTQPADEVGGRGISVETSYGSSEKASLVLERSILCENHDTALHAHGAGVELSESEIVTTLSDPSDDHGFGVALTRGFERSTGTIRSVRLMDNRMVSIAVYESDATIEGVVVDKTGTRGFDGAFGDGIAVMVDFEPASAVIRSTLVRQSARAAVSNFGGAVEIADSRFDCYLFALAGENRSVGPFSFTNRGSNRCGCGDHEEPCAVRTQNLEPPSVPDP
jgi:hypothetical protein